MLNAYVNGVLTKATVSGQRGLCPFCGSEVTSKCGKYRHAHWAHIRKKDCDTWWENETDWHRGWKEHFPQTWQEQIKYDNCTREKHIADLLTETGLVIEFQHSSIKPEELLSRINFYKNILWVVDGCRRTSDFEKLKKAFCNEKFHQLPSIPDWPIPGTKFFKCYFADEVFNKTWLNLPVPIFFDFSSHPDLQILEDSLSMGSLELCCVFPQCSDNAVTAFISKKDFVQAILDGKDFMSPVINWIQKKKSAEQSSNVKLTKNRSVEDLLNGKIRFVSPRYLRTILRKRK